MLPGIGKRTARDCGFDDDPLTLRDHGLCSPLAHYGWGDEDALRPFVAAHEIYDKIWGLYDSQRRIAGLTRAREQSPS